MPFALPQNCIFIDSALDSFQTSYSHLPTISSHKEIQRVLLCVNSFIYLLLLL